MKRIAWGLLAALLAFAAPARADWPDKLIRIMVPFAPGGAAGRASSQSRCRRRSARASWPRTAAAASSPRRRSPVPSRTGTPF